MAEPTPDEIRVSSPTACACEHVEVEGDGRHFFATIVSAEFEGTQPHRPTPARLPALGERMREQIHALSMKTLTPAEYQDHPA